MSALKEFLEFTEGFWTVFRGFFKAMRDPQAHSERVQAEAKAHLDHRLKVSRELGISPKPKEEIRHFQTLAEALDFVARCRTI